MLFVEGVSGGRGRAHEESDNGGGQGDSLAVFPNRFERVKWGEENVRQIFFSHQGDSYTLQVVENFGKYLQTVKKFPVHVV